MTTDAAFPEVAIVDQGVGEQGSQWTGMSQIFTRLTGVAMS